MDAYEGYVLALLLVYLFASRLLHCQGNVLNTGQISHALWAG